MSVSCVINLLREWTRIGFGGADACPVSQTSTGFDAIRWRQGHVDLWISGGVLNAHGVRTGADESADENMPMEAASSATADVCGPKDPEITIRTGADVARFRLPVTADQLTTLLVLKSSEHSHS